MVVSFVKMLNPHLSPLLQLQLKPLHPVLLLPLLLLLPLHQKHVQPHLLQLQLLRFFPLRKPKIKSSSFPRYAKLSPVVYLLPSRPFLISTSTSRPMLHR